MFDARIGEPCTNVVGACTNIVAPCTNVIGACTNVVAPCTNVVGARTNIVAPCTNVVGARTNVVAPCTNVVGACTNVVAPCADAGESCRQPGAAGIKTGKRLPRMSGKGVLTIIGREADGADKTPPGNQGTRRGLKPRERGVTGLWPMSIIFKGLPFFCSRLADHSWQVCQEPFTGNGG
jgi:hypothetical protein